MKKSLTRALQSIPLSESRGGPLSVTDKEGWRDKRKSFRLILDGSEDMLMLSEGLPNRSDWQGMGFITEGVRRQKGWSSFMFI